MGIQELENFGIEKEKIRELADKYAAQTFILNNYCSTVTKIL
ncbi:MAG TPA: hypothetical protein PLM75_00555 [bacterium]|nr:hypothetical protein [bacterium]HPP86336.1 hypothetical protein [bacterium]